MLHGMMAAGEKIKNEDIKKKKKEGKEKGDDYHTLKSQAYVEILGCSQGMYTGGFFSFLYIICIDTILLSFSNRY